MVNNFKLLAEVTDSRTYVFVSVRELGFCRQSSMEISGSSTPTKEIMLSVIQWMLLVEMLHDLGCDLGETYGVIVAGLQWRALLI